MGTVYNSFLKQASRLKDKKAIIAQNEDITYGELNTRVENLSARYEEFGFTTEDVICLLYENSIEFLTSFLAAAKNNICVIPIDTRLSFREMHRIADLIQPTTIICQKEYRDAGKRLLSTLNDASIIEAQDANYDGKFCFLYYKEKRLKNPAFCRDDFAVLFSSGSTGTPKGVALSQKKMIDQILTASKYFGVTESDRILCAVTLVHGYGISDHALTSLIAGATLYLPNIRLITPRMILNIIHDERITFFGTLPYMYDMMASLNLKKAYDFSSVRYMLVGGAPVVKETIDKFEKKFGRRPNQVYGSTELGYVAFNKENRIDSVGKPVSELEIKIVDHEGNECEDGVEGELAVKLNHLVARGYFRNPEEQNLMYKQDWFYTKDILRRDTDGYLYYCGRISDFLNVGGNKVSALDIESVINNTAGIKESAVLGIQNHQGHQEIYAVLVPHDNADIGSLELTVTEHCAKNLAAFKKPSKFIFMKELPKTLLGKVKKGDLIAIVKQQLHQVTSIDRTSCGSGSLLQ